MPSLAGLFGRKAKAAPKQRSETFTDSPLSSPSDYVSPDKSLPSSPNGRSTLHPDSAYSSVYPSLAVPSSSTSKLRLPFSRKKVSQQQRVHGSATSIVSTGTGHDSTFSSPPRPAYLASSTPRSSISSVDGDSPRRLRPPPSKSAIFAAYNDPHLSTRSLPNESPSLMINTNTAKDVPPVPPKKPGFFHWSKSAPKPSLSLPSPTDTSFNLKAFRHVGPPSPNPVSSPTSPTSRSPASNLSPTLGVAVPRPRGTSVASDSSQRISVAAFREAQARRSNANSPSPSLRAPSPSPGTSYNRPNPTTNKRTSGLAYADSDSDESDYSQEEEDQDATVRARGQIQKRPVGRATKSEVGHGHGRAQSGNALMSQYPGHSKGEQEREKEKERERENGRAHSSLGFNVGPVRPRASASASAITPSGAAKRASVLAAANANTGGNASAPKRHSRAISDHGVPLSPSSAPSSTPQHSTNHGHTRQPALARPRLSSVSSSSSSDDDAPLATLVPPRRPGSALSNLSSSSNPNTRPKPLVDIAELTRGRPVPVHQKATDGAFTGGLLGQGQGQGLGVKTSVSPPRRFVSPPSSPTRASAAASSSVIVSAKEKETEKEKEKEGLGERLTRVVQMQTKTRSAEAASVLSGTTGSVYSTTSSNGGPFSAPVPVRSMTAPAPAPVATPVRMPVPRANTTFPTTTPTTTTKPTPRPTPVVQHKKELSPPEEDLATLLGAGVHLIHRTGDSDSEEEEEAEETESEESEGDSEVDSDFPAKEQAKKGEGEPTKTKTIAPIPIKQRVAPAAFSVTSRPPLRGASSATPAPAPAPVTSSDNVFSNTKAHVRQRSSTLLPAASKGILSTSPEKKEVGTRDRDRDREREREREQRPPTTRQRSSTLLPGSVSVSASSLSPIPSSSGSTGSSVAPRALNLNLNSVNAGSGGASTNMNTNTNTNTVKMPSRPWRESPAGSSTGDSSSGRAPVTPRDGSDLGLGVGGTRAVEDGASQWSGGVSGLGLGGRHIKRRSVSFEDDLGGGGSVGGGRGVGKGKVGKVGKVEGEEGNRKDGRDGEERRKERRRSEAKAAIELGIVINGRGPVVDDDDDDDDLPINQTLANASQGRMPMPGLNPMMGAWNMPNMPNPMMSPNMMSPAMGADPGYIAAHQQAMLFAKQAYQMAVAQQAMAAAGDEWERGSAYGGPGAGSVYGGAASVYGGGSVYGGVGGGGGSVYGGVGGGRGSVYGMPGMGMPGMGGMGMPGMNVGMMPGMQPNGWSTGSAIFPAPARPMYGAGGPISGARSEYGGGGGGGNWSSSKSSYGDYGASNRTSKMLGGGGGGRQRESGYFPPMPPVPQQQQECGSARDAEGTHGEPAGESEFGQGRTEGAAAVQLEVECGGLMIHSMNAPVPVRPAEPWELSQTLDTTSYVPPLTKKGSEKEKSLPAVAMIPHSPGLIGKIEKTENRKVINSSGNHKIQAYKCVAAKVLSEIFKIDEGMAATWVKSKWEGLHKTYAAQAWSLYQTGGRIQDPSAQETDEFSLCYIPAEGPNETTTAEAKNIWDKIQEQFEFFPRLHQILSTCPNITPIAVTTGVGPLGHKTIHYQAPESHQATSTEDKDANTNVDPALHNLDVNPIVKANPPAFPPDPEDKENTPARGPKPSTFESTLLGAAITKASSTIKQIPQKHTVEDSFITMQKWTLKLTE
ncbi:hypothetical protein DXG01_014196 [Tephrocybe rancida]|nr:hypothetical protein DXG01_014196 [Tephrocybe rancida]